MSKEKKKKKEVDPTFDKEKEKLHKFDPRGTQTLFRTLMRNHYNLLRMVDNKASIILTVNSIIISLLMGVIFVAPDDSDGVLELGSKVLLNFGMASMVFALLAMVPHKYIGMSKNKTGYKGSLYASNFSKMTLPQFQEEMHRIIASGNSVYEEMISDLYYLGKTISFKQKMILTSVVLFFVGLVITIVHTISHGIMIESILFQK